jgi:alpha-tubulin suppressor-like RCC1 family protein
MSAIRLWCAALVLVALACSGSEPTGPTTGGVLVAAATSGADLDLDGYTVTLDSATLGGGAQSLAVNGTVTFPQLSPGSHLLTLAGVAANCGVVGDNPRPVTVTAGRTAEITFQVACLQRVDVAGVWNYTERIGSPLACYDTGSYVFIKTGDGFGGTNDQVGTCDQQDGSIDNTSSAPFTGGSVFRDAASGVMSISFSVASCYYSAQIAGTPPNHLVNGSVSCPDGSGTWEAVVGGGPISSVAVSPPAASVVAGGTALLRAVLLESNGSRRVGPTVTWTSDASAVATVDASGAIAGVAPGSATITAAAATKSGTATVSVEVVRFATVQAGAYHSCGLTTSGAAYCWGNGTYGQLGNGAKASRLAPVAVAGSLSLNAISVGAIHSCGLTASGAAYCWGSDLYGELGAGVTASQQCGTGGSPCSTTPLAVARGLTFASVSAGWEESCALTSSGAAYCWGDNSYGELGDGSTASTRTPVAVTGALTFVSVGTGNVFACGLTAAGAAYCWGNNSAGQLGIGPGGSAHCGAELCSTAPVAVSGGLTFTALSVGYWHACGLTSGGAAYCWGDNDGWQLGATTQETCAGFGVTISCSTVPLLVEGGPSLSFAGLSAGSSHTCTVSSGGDGYCWGANGYGQLGNGTATSSRTPVAMTGGLSFAALSTFGRWHSCGVSAASIAYCWGFNPWGQLGDGGTVAVTEPVRVIGQAAAVGSAPLRASRVRLSAARAAARLLSPQPPTP